MLAVFIPMMAIMTVPQIGYAMSVALVNVKMSDDVPVKTKYNIQVLLGTIWGTLMSLCLAFKTTLMESGKRR